MLPQHQSSVRCLKMGGSCQVCVRIRLFRVGTGWHAGSLKYGRRCHSSSGRRGKRKTTATVFHNAMCCQWSMCSSILWSLLPDGGEFSTAHENIEYVTASLEQLSKIFWRIEEGWLKHWFRSESDMSQGDLYPHAIDCASRKPSSVCAEKNRWKEILGLK